MRKRADFGKNRKGWGAMGGGGAEERDDEGQGWVAGGCQEGTGRNERGYHEGRGVLGIGDGERERGGRWGGGKRRTHLTRGALLCRFSGGRCPHAQLPAAVAPCDSHLTV